VAGTAIHIAGAEQSGLTGDECCQLCDSYSNCVAAPFNPVDGRCWPLKGYRGLEADTGRNTYIPKRQYQTVRGNRVRLKGALRTAMTYEKNLGNDLIVAPSSVTNPRKLKVNLEIHDDTEAGKDDCFFGEYWCSLMQQVGLDVTQVSIKDEGGPPLQWTYNGIATCVGLGDFSAACPLKTLHCSNETTYGSALAQLESVKVASSQPGGRYPSFSQGC